MEVENFNNEHTILFSQGINPANNNNPYDSLGLTHNQLPDAFAFDQDFPLIDRSEYFSDYIQFQKGWLDMNQYYSSNSTDSLSNRIWNLLINEGDLDGTFQYLEDLDSLNSNLLNELMELFSILPFESESFSFEDLIDSIKYKGNL